ncbi:lysophospholipid acyltransferase family protein [Thalassolituus sp. LLYu03]|uniref:lysophospholipid acyltransferase family protein n=1 Tax=Thalassolituus sp. LLYu03 TaxID=3421656 RepID=UPI003D2BAA1A
MAIFTDSAADVSPVSGAFLKVRTTCFYVWLTLITLVWFIPSFTIGLFLPLKARNYFVMVVPCQLAIWGLRLFCGIRCQLEGKENIPRDGRSCVLLSKHQSTWETFFLPTLIAPHVQVVKKELFYLPLFGWMLNLIHPIFIDRSQKTNALKQVLTQGADRLNSGIHVLVFPEGTRVPPGKRKAFSKGGAMLATKSQAPVLAIAHNSGEHWPNNSWVKRPGTIHLVISPLIEPEGMTTAQLSERVEGWINLQVERVSATPFSGDVVEADSSGKRF